LIGIIVVGDGADLALSRFLRDGLRRFEAQPEQCRHRALHHRHRRLHRPPAQLEKPRGGRDVERLGGAKGGIFSEAVAGDEIGLVAEADAPFPTPSKSPGALAMIAGCAFSVSVSSSCGPSAISRARFCPSASSTS
jgi:hypothetical protein